MLLSGLFASLDTKLLPLLIESSHQVDGAVFSLAIASLLTVCPSPACWLVGCVPFETLEPELVSRVVVVVMVVEASVWPALADRSLRSLFVEESNSTPSIGMPLSLRLLVPIVSESSIIFFNFLLLVGARSTLELLLLQLGALVLSDFELAWPDDSGIEIKVEALSDDEGADFNSLVSLF